VIPVLGGPERKLLTLHEDVGMPAWSPDGKYIVISERPAPQKAYALFLLSLETLEKRQLTFPDAQTMGDYGGRLSPDGRQVAFLRNTRETSDVYLLPAAGGETRRLTFENSIFSGLDWTADGSELIFSSFRGGSNPSLWRVSATGANLRRLGVGGDGVSGPSVAPKGNRLAYVQIRWNEDIARLPIPRPGARAESATPLIASTQNEEGPQYSPDGKKIAFQSTRSGSYEIWVCDADGSNPLQLTSFRGPLTGTPRWSPDGQQLAFDSRPERYAQIFTIQGDGGVPRQLTSGNFNHVTPSWSRDGKWIYFASDRSGSFQVWKMAADGSGMKQVTQKGGFAGFESFDGKHFYYSLRIDVPGIWRVPVEGGEEVEVLKDPPAGFWGYWALDRDGIYYLEAKEKPGKGTAKELQAVVQYVNLATGKTREVARPEKEPYFGAPGLAVSPDGRYLLYLQVTEQSSDIMLVENFR
jgi:Tol biopolymer transport system component